jgi:hypothetical protein
MPAIEEVFRAGPLPLRNELALEAIAMGILSMRRRPVVRSVSEANGTPASKRSGTMTTDVARERI